LKTPPRSGAVVGLVIITPACGYVDLNGAFFMALVGSPMCYKALRYKNPSILDDAMDSFAIHGVGGALGSLLTGFFANDEVTGESRAKGAFFNGNWVQVARQLCGVCAVAAWSFSMTLAILFFVDQALIQLAGKPYRLAADGEDQSRGLDTLQHVQPEEGAVLPQQACLMLIPGSVNPDAAQDVAPTTALDADQGRAMHAHSV
jgi:Amt family ammonium transporter